MSVGEHMSRKESTIGIFNKESRFTKATAAVASVLAAGAIAGCSPKESDTPKSEQTTSQQEDASQEHIDQAYAAYRNMDLTSFALLPEAQRNGDVGFNLEFMRKSPSYLSSLQKNTGIDYSHVANTVVGPDNLNSEILDMHSVNRAITFYDPANAPKIAYELYNPGKPGAGYKALMEEVGALSPDDTEYNLLAFQEVSMPESGPPSDLAALGSGTQPLRLIRTKASDGWNRYLVFQLVDGKSTIDGQDHSYWRVVDQYMEGFSY